MLKKRTWNSLRREESSQAMVATTTTGFYNLRTWQCWWSSIEFLAEFPDAFRLLWGTCRYPDLCFVSFSLLGTLWKWIRIIYSLSMVTNSLNLPLIDNCLKMCETMLSKMEQQLVQIIVSEINKIIEIYFEFQRRKFTFFSFKHFNPPTNTESKQNGPSKWISKRNNLVGNKCEIRSNIKTHCC